MKRQQPRRWRALMALGAASSLLIAACADDDDGEDTDAAEDTDEGTGEETDLSGETVTVFGPEVEVEQQSLQESFDGLTEDGGPTVEVRGDRDFETQIVVDVEGGSPPDIAMFPQPGAVLDMADQIAPLTDDVVSEVEENFDAGWTDLVTVDDQLLGVPAKADLKSVVWYNPSVFADNEYEIPETWEDFEGLVDQMLADGNTPFCLGLESGDATGWPGTDWIEDWMLRLQGPDVYDEWWQHEIPFNDDAVVETGEAVYDLWSQEGMVFGGLDASASTPFQEAGLPVMEGDCMMYRMGNFYAANFLDAGAELGEEGDVNAFYLPGSEENPNITLSGGIYAVAFNDDPATMAAMEYIASTDFANARAGNEIGGFLSPNSNVDPSLYPSELEQTFGQILADAEPVRFDASDLMPSQVGSGSFWEAMVNIATGSQTVDEAFGNVEDSWPS